MTIRRMKTYTGATGYVYQYYFVGKRPAIGDAHPAATQEFVFDVTSDRKTMFAASVFMRKDAVQHWAAEHGRELTDTEQYAAAKMRLFQGFDEIADMREGGRRLVVDASNIGPLLADLHLE